MDSIKICALGGLDENGRDCYVVEINDDMFVVECGVSYPDKTMPGIDILMPNPDYLRKNIHRLKAYIITHGHNEAMAGLKYYYKKAPAPVYCTFTTMCAIKCQASIHHGNANDFDFKIVAPNDDLDIAGHKIRLFQTCHNAANSFGVCFETDRGNIIYSSDFIIDFTPNLVAYKFGFEKLTKIATKPTLLLMSESEAADKEGYCSPKYMCANKVRQYFKKNKRIFISCFWQNTYRLHEIVNLCNEYNKKIYFYDEYTKTIMESVIRSDADINISPDNIVAKEDFIRVPPSELVVLMLGHSLELFNQIIYLAEGVGPDIRIKLTPDDVFINCALPLITQEIKATECVDIVYRSGCEVVWLRNKKDVYPMHARQDDLKTLITILRPQYYFPVRGLFTQLMTNARLSLGMGVGLNHMNVFVLDNGMQVAFDKDVLRPRIIQNSENHIDVSPLVVDGVGISKNPANIVEERKILGTNGTVIIAASVSKSEKKIIAGPDCQMRGFVFVKEAEPILKSITQIFIDEINTAISLGKFDFEQAKTNIMERAHRFIRRENGREPMIFPIIQVID